MPPNEPPATYSDVGRAINQLEDRLDARLDVFHQELALLRASVPPAAVPSDSAPPPSRKVRAMQVTGKAATWAGVATLVLTIALQLATTFKPGMVGPLQHIIDTIGKLTE